MSNLVQLIKQASLEAGEAAAPVAIEFGTVISVAPLKIQIDQKKILTGAFLIIPESLTDHAVSMTVSHSTETAGAHSHSGAVPGESPHSHNYSGTKSFTMLNGLRVAERVILLRIQGGQQYLVLDRMVIG